MSSFFSNRYLKFRRLMQHDAPLIVVDVPCRHCGYNLRGLKQDGKCPECGRPIPLDFTITDDPLVAGTNAQRKGILWGLTLIVFSSVSEVAVRLGFALGWALHAPAPLWLYIACNIAIDCAWTLGVFCATPRRFDAALPRRAWLRLIARWTQIAWLPADVCWLLAETKYAFMPQQDALMMWSMLLPVAGWVGLLALGFYLLRLAEDVEMDDAPRRIGMAIWTVPVLTIVLLIVPLQAYFFVLALVMPLLLAWAWYVVGFARGVWEIRQHVAWGMRPGAEPVDREARIAATRAKLDREVKMQIRPIPAPPHAPPTSPQTPRRSRNRGR